jgi:hypothetical protein
LRSSSGGVRNQPYVGNARGSFVTRRRIKGNTVSRPSRIQSCRDTANTEQHAESLRALRAVLLRVPEVGDDEFLSACRATVGDPFGDHDSGSAKASFIG